MRRRTSPLVLIEQLLQSLHKRKLVYSMWHGTDMEVLAVESQLIELRTRCERREVTTGAALRQLEPLRARVKRSVRRLRKHPTLTRRMAKIAPPRDFTLVWHAASALLIVASTVLIVLAAASIA